MSSLRLDSFSSRRVKLVSAWITALGPGSELLALGFLRQCGGSLGCGYCSSKSPAVRACLRSDWFLPLMAYDHPIWRFSGPLTYTLYGTSGHYHLMRFHRQSSPSIAKCRCLLDQRELSTDSVIVIRKTTELHDFLLSSLYLLKYEIYGVAI